MLIAGKGTGMFSFVHVEDAADSDINILIPLCLFELSFNVCFLWLVINLSRLRITVTEKLLQ